MQDEPIGNPVCPAEPKRDCQDEKHNQQAKVQTSQKIICSVVLEGFFQRLKHNREHHRARGANRNEDLAGLLATRHDKGQRGEIELSLGVRVGIASRDRRTTICQRIVEGDIVQQRIG